jgi:hypothetical protein
MCYFPPRHRPPVDTRNVIPSCPLLPPKVYVIIVYDRDIVIRTASVLTLQNHTPGVQSGGSQRSGDASLSHGHRLSKYSRLHHTIYDRRTTEWETTRMLHVSLTCISTMTVGGAEELDRIRQRLLRGNYASGYVPSAFGQGCDTAGRTHAQWHAPPLDSPRRVHGGYHLASCPVCPLSAPQCGRSILSLSTSSFATLSFRRSDSVRSIAATINECGRALSPSMTSTCLDKTGGSSGPGRSCRSRGSPRWGRWGHGHHPR